MPGHAEGNGEDYEYRQRDNDVDDQARKHKAAIIEPLLPTKEKDFALPDLESPIVVPDGLTRVVVLLPKITTVLGSFCRREHYCREEIPRFGTGCARKACRSSQAKK